MRTVQEKGCYCCNFTIDAKEKSFVSNSVRFRGGEGGAMHRSLKVHMFLIVSDADF